MRKTGVKLEENCWKIGGKLVENWRKTGGNPYAKEAGITAHRKIVVIRSRICRGVAAARMKRPKNLPGSSCRVPMGGTVFKRWRNSNKSF